MPAVRFAPIAARIALLFALLAAPQLAAAETPSATAIVTGFYSVLLDTMKNGPELKFAGRVQRLTPAMAASFDLASMTRIAAGAHWRPCLPKIRHS